MSELCWTIVDGKWIGSHSCWRIQIGRIGKVWWLYAREVEMLTCIQLPFRRLDGALDYITDLVDKCDKVNVKTEVER